MWLAALLLGCGVSRFEDDRAAAICARHERCDTFRAAGFDDAADCLAALDDANGDAWRAGQQTCGGFDADAADTCIAVWEDTPCEETLDLSPCDGVCRE